MADLILSPIPSKTCTKCGEVKPMHEFGLVSASKDGRHCYCKACKRAVQSNTETEAMLQYAIAKELKASAEFISCKCCGQTKKHDTENFYSGSRGKLFSKCKPCVSKETKERKITANPELLSKRMARKAELERIKLLQVKVCTVCGVEKPATNEFFYNQKLGVFGLNAMCKCCAAKRDHEKRFNADAALAKAEVARLLAIGLKRCVKCDAEKPIDQFNNISKSTDGKDGYCKDCRSILHKEYRAKNGELIKQKSLESRSGRRDEINALAKKYREANKDVIQLRNRVSWLKNRHKYNAYHREYRQNNKAELAIKKRARSKNRVRIDPVYAMRVRIRGLISASIRNYGWTKKSRTHEILGCSYKEFVVHIERQFTKGMSWGRKSEIHIDHIVPLSSAKNEEDVLALNHFTNLRPMWAVDNISKGASITHLI